ncbi:MAG: glycosyltransferase [Verrucomicrobia bacterium]|nr:glycosyltransferase [Verrucomicrobiota bacterium]
MKKFLASKKSWVFTCAALCAVFYPVYLRFWQQPDLTVCGFVDMADGLGRQSIELIEAFQDELNVSFLPTRAHRLADVTPALQRVVARKKKQLGKVVIFEDLLWWPQEEKYRKMASRDSKDSIKIAYSMFEATKIPNEWVVILNNHFDAVAVPDHFLRDVYKNSGVKIPIFIVPLGLNLKPLLEQPLKQQRHSPMVFGNLGAGSDRKNQLLLVRAFAKAFGNDPNVRLRINCRGGEREVCNAITREIVQQGLTNVEFTQFSLSRAEYLKLFQEIDCLVSISKSEGFSIQPREAMALGIPVIATDNTAQRTICDSGLVRTVHSPFQELSICPWGNAYGYAFNCTMDSVVEALHDMHNNYESYLQKAPSARKWAEQYQYENLKALYRSLIKPKKVVLGTVDQVTELDLTTVSEELVEKYKRISS